MYPPCPDFSLQQGPAADAWRGAGAEIKGLKVVMIIRKSSVCPDRASQLQALIQAALREHLWICLPPF